MSAVERELAETIENMDINGFLERWGMDDLPSGDTMALHRNRRSLRVALPAEFWQENGRSLEKPGDVDIYYWTELGIAMIDIAEGDNE